VQASIVARLAEPPSAATNAAPRSPTSTFAAAASASRPGVFRSKRRIAKLKAK
jgi:hypothetical protein